MSDHPALSPYPRVTMRLQLSGTFTFGDAARLVPYIADLGVSHVYASPVLAARAGSTHGYDIVDHNRLNEEFGGEAEFYQLVGTLHAHGLGLILDFVPNHMGVGYSDNAWWLNVLEWGRHSPYAQFFDIDWNPSEQTLRGKVLVPVLGAQYGSILESGELKLTFDREIGAFSVYYYEHRFPIAPKDYAVLLREAAASLSADGRPVDALSEVADSFGALRSARSASRQAVAIRRAEELRSSLGRLIEEHPAVGAAIDLVCAAWNGTPGEPRSFDRLHRLLERQAYRPSYWRLASNEINYRRFFDINDLAGIRMERDDVFEVTHELILSLVRDGAVQGLRLDHIDGLFDPKRYLERLQQSAAYRLLGQSSPRFEGREATLDQPFYVVVEKILAHHESLRGDWPVSGTTGYDHMALVAEILTDPQGEEPLTRIYEDYIGSTREFDELVLSAKYRTMEDTLASELNVLANRMSRLAKRSRRTRDFSRLALRRALMDVVANFPVYRSYADASGIADADRRDIDWAVGKARKAGSVVDQSAYDFVHDVLTTDLIDSYPRQFRRREVVEIAMKVQQFSAPVMAKSVEDTAFYRDARLVARNEVGSDPDQFYAGVQAFHYACRDRRERHPFAMLTTATHDHKRGEDVRARLSVLSEVPDRWAEWVDRMAEYGSVFVTQREEGSAPSLRDQYILLQTLVGTWPFSLQEPDYPGLEEYRERIASYLGKASREAKLHTSWTNPDEAYEAALERFIESILSDRRSSTMLRVIGEFVESIVLPGALNGLSQKLLTLTAPGVPDVYQGTEGWDLSLVDPDNRRPVDFTERREWLDRHAPGTDYLTRVLETWRSGEIKFAVVAAALALRRSYPDVFAAGTYIPIEAEGEAADHLVAFARVFHNDSVLVVVPRLTAAMLSRAELPMVPPERWAGTHLLLPTPPDTTFTDVFADRTRRVFSHGGRSVLNVQDVLSDFPVALLYAAQSEWSDGGE